MKHVIFLAALLALAACVGQVYPDEDMNYHSSFHPSEMAINGG